MGITSRLCNPTPDPVGIEWEPGVTITIPSDGYVDLTHDQLKDFSPGNPGSASIKNTYLDFNGIFLLDPDLSYDKQAYDSISLAVKIQEEEYRTRIQNLRNSRTAAGMKPDDEAMSELEKMSGLNLLRVRVEKLKKRYKILEKTMGKDSATKQAKKIDFSRTCLATNPPREFASPTALSMFLEEHPEIKQKHETLIKAMKEPSVANNAP